MRGWRETSAATQLVCLTRKPAFKAATCSRLNVQPHMPHAATARAAGGGEGEGVAALSLSDKARVLWTALPRGYWQALATTCILYLARFDVAFITVHASSVRGRVF